MRPFTVKIIYCAIYLLLKLLTTVSSNYCNYRHDFAQTFEPRQVLEGVRGVPNAVVSCLEFALEKYISILFNSKNGLANNNCILKWPLLWKVIRNAS